MSKGLGRSQKVGDVWEMFEMQKVALQKQESKENSLIKKYKQHQYFPNFEKNLLVNITKGAIFS